MSTPAAPGSGAILLFTILTGMGYTNQYALAAYSFILAINRPVEMLVTAINVVDDGVSAVCVAHDLEELNLKTYHESPQSLQNEEPVLVKS
ncbi:cation:dicarboxylate symporter family transporter [Erysipelothrix piscisicarius]|uniref:cation:dicarboxylate symporter family transporter n=1 Tax=Erysipelothrix piscisicarius TaxID=2485784 RepID=UPI002F934CC0